MKKKKNLKPNLPKQYVWELEVAGEDKTFSCVVSEDECVTYEDGVEHKHLKVMDHTCEVGVLQIDTQTKVYGDLVPFQLERYIPYIKLDGKWVMSDTTRKDRMEEQIAIYKKQSKQECIAGIGCLLVVLAKRLITGGIDDWWMLIVFGIFFMSSAAFRMVRLRNEINAMKEAEAEAQEEAQFRRGENAAVLPEKADSEEA